MKHHVKFASVAVLLLLGSMPVNSFSQNTVSNADLKPQERARIVCDILIETPVQNGTEFRVTFKDEKGRYVTGLDQQGVLSIIKPKKEGNCPELKVAEINKKVTSDTLSIAIVLDYSGTMYYSYEEMQRIAWAFMQSLTAARFSRVVFDHHIQRMTATPVSNPDKIQKHEYDKFGGATQLFGGISDGIETVKGVNGPKVVIAFTDGIDNASGISANGLIKKAWDENVSIYAIYDPTNENDYMTLRAITQKTGGNYYRVDQFSQLSEKFDSLTSDFQHYYILKVKCDEKGVELPVEIAFNESQPAKVFALERAATNGLIPGVEGDRRNFFCFLFEHNSTQLIPSQRHGELKRIAHNIADYLMEDSRNNILLVGHASPEGDSLSNLYLSKQRVDYIYRELDSYVIKKYKKKADKYKAAKLRNRIQIKFEGPEDPVNDPKGRFNRENRRVEIYGYKQ